MLQERQEQQERLGLRVLRDWQESRVLLVPQVLRELQVRILLWLVLQGLQGRLELRAQPEPRVRLELQV